MDEPHPIEKETGNIIDIFILSSDEKTVLQLREHMAQKDYRITVFPDSASLKEALFLGKPNLLICDCTTEQQEGFAVCHQIKADNDLWVIPVLVLTSSATLRDLLNVLDSNADNFIAQPYYPPYFLLLVEGMLATPVERQEPAHLKTQFKISHEGRTYVVSANRRKLLEYLLSAFEIAVNKTSELSHVTSELQVISESVKELERSITTHTNVIEMLNKAIQQKDQKIAALTLTSDEQDQVLAQKSSEIEGLRRECDANTMLISTRDETIRTMAREREEERAASRSDTDALISRISTLENEYGALKADLHTVQSALDEETAKSVSREKTLRALTLEHEQQKAALAAERNRAESAEQEVGAVMQAKTQSEQDLTRIITDLKMTAKQQAAELVRVKSEMDVLNRQVSKLEENLSVSAATLDNESGIKKSQEGQLTKLRAELEMTSARLQSVVQELKEAQDAVSFGEQKRQSLATDLEELIELKEKSEKNAKTLSVALETAQSEIESERLERRRAEETLGKTTRERDDALELLHHEYDTVQTDLDSHKMALAEREHDLEATISVRETLEKELETLKAKNRMLEEELEQEAQSRTKSMDQSHVLSDELEQLKAALETERRLRRISEEKTKSSAQQKEDLELHLRNTHEEMERVKNDREATFRRFKDELETASHQILSLEEKISALEQEKIQPKKEIAPDQKESQDKNHQLLISGEPHLPVVAGPASELPVVETPPAVSRSSDSEKDLPVQKTPQEMPQVFSGVIPQVPDISGADTLFVVRSHGAENASPDKEPSPASDDQEVLSGPADEVQPEQEDEEEREQGGIQGEFEDQSMGSPEDFIEQIPYGDISFNRKQWMDLLKWAHHSGALSQDQRLKIVRMGRLIQKDRKMTQKQQNQIREIIAFVYALGYRPE